ncbi:MAG: OmpP1/FadL family transporter [Chitinophagales bacterium]
MKQIYFCLFFFIYWPFYVSAGGFQVTLQGQKQTGMGHVGVAVPLDASAVFFNPGAMAFLKTPKINFGISPVFANINFQQASTGIGSSNEPIVGTPFGAYYAMPLSQQEDSFWSQFSFGLAVNTPFGSSVAYPDEWVGRFLAQKVSLTTILIQPSLSINVQDKLGVGVGLSYGIGNFSIQRAAPLYDNNGTEGKLNLEGSGRGAGLNIGVYVEPIEEKLAFGVSYRTTIGVPLENGDATFDVPPAVANLFPATTFSSFVTLPDIMSFGLTYYTSTQQGNTDKSRASFVSIEVNRAGWSVYEELKFDFAEPVGGATSLASARQYEDNYSFRLGYQHFMNEKITLRAGTAYDLSAAPDCCVTPETPDANKLSFSVGATIRPTDKIDIDASFVWVEASERTTINTEADFEATYKVRAFVPGIGVQYSF